MIITDLFESHQLCPECGGPAFSDLILAEKKDACYSKVRSRYKVWPSAYASGALVQCRKKGAANWGNKSKNESVTQGQDPALIEEFDLIENIINNLAKYNNVDAEVIWEDLESLSDDELYVFAVTSPLMEDWQKANKQDRTDGMSRRAVKAYRREHPGSKLKTAVTTKPSKLKRGSKASKRRSSYCSRSRGQMKMHSISCSKTPDKAICKARRRWNCESVDSNGTMVAKMDKSQPSHGRDGKISHSTYGSRDKKGSDYFKGKEAPGKPVTAKQASKDALDILKKQGVAESDTGDTPIESMTAQELAAYLNVPVTQVTQDLAAAREMARDQAKDMVGEGMADDLLKIAQKISPGARLRGTPDQERERDQQIRAQREQERQAIQQSMIQADIDKLPELEAQYQEMKQLYDSLGGSNWQYADREQNLSSSERRARDMEPQMQQLFRRIQMAKQAQNIAEGNLEANSADPVVVILDPAGKYLDKMALSAAAQKYPLGTPDAIKKQLAHQNYTKIGQYTIQAPMTGQPAEPAMAESLDRILKLSGLRP